MQQDTICALCTAPGVAAMAIIRVSGRQSLSIVEQIFSKTLQDKASHTLHFGILMHQNEIIDQVVISIFKNPHSFTGEDVVEITCHGSLYIQEKILQILIEKGCRLARNGEFTQRAFLNGKMDLPQAESILDLIHAQSESQHKMAMAQMKGHFSQIIKQLRAQLLQIAALLELELDFSGEDVEFASRAGLYDLLVQIKGVCAHLMASYKTGSVLKKGIPVAIIGAPNAGKSTLLNALIGENRALVSNIAGTTRDAIEEVLNIDGVLFRIIDTAGIRETTDVIEKMGIERSLQAADKALMVLYMVDATAPVETLHANAPVETLHATSLPATSLTATSLQGKKVFVLYNKIDLATEKTLPEGVIGISAQRGLGLEVLKKAMLSAAQKEQQSGEFLVSSLRHYEALQRSFVAVEQTQQAFEQNLPSDLIAFHVRDVVQALAEITGEVSHEDLLDKIFREFCIGK